MRVANPTMTEPGFITLCIQMAQSTFSDVMPSRTDTRAKANGSKSTANGAGSEPKWIAAIGDWFYRQQVKEREAYLAQSSDIFDLERRIRQLDRGSSH